MSTTHFDEPPSDDRARELSSLFRDFVRIEAAQLPLPGSGDTWRRFAILADWASRDLSLGRLCEGHADALAILAEAGLSPVAGASYGVWTSRGSGATSFAERVEGGWRLSGTKEFCSGSRILDRALVSAVTSEGYMLFDVDATVQVSSVVEGSWPAVGMANSMSETLEFAGPIIPNSQEVGPPDFYLQRPGFWFGGVGVASCWFGGAVGLVNALVKWINSEPRESILIDLGVAVSELETMRYTLRDAAREIDEDPLDESRQAQCRALVIRHAVHRAALTVLERVASAGGARPLCHDESQSRRAADLYVYLSQHHGNVDSEELGRMLMTARSWSSASSHGE
ncbi:MAG TPA: hypothetical protein VIJ86_02330 [Acidimicrobiales bacterium]